MVILSCMSVAGAWTLPEVPPAVADPPEFAAASGLPESQSTEFTKMRTQRLIERVHEPQVYRVTDFVVGGGKRKLTTLPWESRCPVTPWWERPDPYWETLVFDSKRTWRRPTTGTGEATGEESPFPVTGSGHSSQKPTLDLEEIPLNDYAHIVGLLRLVGVMSTPQVEAITGDKRARGKLRKLGFAGVIEQAFCHAPGIGFPRIEMWRVRSGERYAAYASHIMNTGILQHRIYCGLSPYGALPGVQHTRHQSLAVEMMLRSMELGGPWLGWLPEAVCTPDRFLPQGHPHLPAEREAAAVMARERRKNARPRILSGLAPDEEIDYVSVRADGALVRLDGHKVFIELQAGTSPESVLRKVANWSRLLASAPFGGLVLFVAAPKPAALGITVAEIKQTIINEAPREHWPSFLVASWEDWSPDHGELTDDCRVLRAARFIDRNWVATDAATAPIAQPLPDWHLIGRLSELRITPPWLGH